MTKRSARGRLIVFEGPDGVGKSTLAQRLATSLTGQGVQCEYVAFPGKQPGSLGHLVYELHHDARRLGVDYIPPTSLQVLHIAAHLDAIEERILPALKAGRWIILDRFWWSAWVYGTALGVAKRSLKAMIRLEQLHWKRVKPGVVFLVERKAAMPEQNDEVRKAVVAGYRLLADQERHRSPVQTIYNESSVEDALNEVWGTMETFLQLPRPGEPFGDGRLQDGQLSPPTDRPPKAPRISRLSPAKSTVVYDTYWRFAAERQEVFFRRLEGGSPPWTDDPIMDRYKFTNVHRASDRVSQYLIRRVIYEGDQSPQEVFFRTLLFKVFNKIETWELLKAALGEVGYCSYSFNTYDRVLTEAFERGRAIYSAAYIMPSARGAFGYPRKHRNHLKLIERMMADEVPDRVAGARTMREAFEILRSYPSIGDFLAYQFVTDLNYSELTTFSEMEFVVPGPGALDGISKCFSDLGGLNEADVIRVMTDLQEYEFERLNLRFRSLWGRRLQLIDCQNLFCEVSKYARLKHPEFKGVSNRSRIKQIFRPTAEPVRHWYPPKWGINHLIPPVETSDV